MTDLDSRANGPRRAAYRSPPSPPTVLGLTFMFLPCRLTGLFEMLRDTFALHEVQYGSNPYFADTSPGNVRHNEADMKSEANDELFSDTRAGRRLAEPLPW